MYSKKQNLDKFYTKPVIANQCLDLLNLDEYDFIIEPSAGNGSFINLINHHNKIGLDIKPDHPSIVKQDWFKYIVPSNYKKVLIVGNPPFGIRNKLSAMFLRHACSFTNVQTIAFILPNVYNKHTLQKNISYDFRIKDIVKLPENSFSIGNQEYHVPCSFFIFDKSEGKCLRFQKDLYQETPDWTYATNDDYDFFVMGAACNNTKRVPEKNNRGYYIKVKDKQKIDEVNNRFKSMKVTSHSTVNGGVSWLTKPELVKNYLDNYYPNLFTKE